MSNLIKKQSIQNPNSDDFINNPSSNIQRSVKQSYTNNTLENEMHITNTGVVVASTLKRSSSGSGNQPLLPVHSPPSPQKGELKWLGLSIGLWSLMILVLQNSSLVLVMRYSKLTNPNYLSSTVVFTMEIVKMLTCFGIIYLENPGDFRNRINRELLNRSSLLLLIPSGIYAIQNNLLFIAVENLEAATFQILYQLKILTTALFSVSMLSKSLSGSKWISLVILMAGVAMVQLETMKTSSSSGQSNTKTGDPLLGLITVVTACITSGFAGVYFEKILKTSPTSIWMRNIQLSLFGASFSWAAMMINDGSKVMEKGVWQNYDWVTWVVVFNQALGGLIVAIVVKYADNILKGFATSISILVSALVSVWLFNFRPSMQFIVGAGIVFLAVYLYGRPDSSSEGNGGKSKGTS